MLRRKFYYLTVCLLIAGLLLGAPVVLAAEVDLSGLYDELKNNPAYEDDYNKLLSDYSKQGGNDLDGDVQALLDGIETSLNEADPEEIDTEAKITNFIVGEALSILSSDDRYTPLFNALGTSVLKDFSQKQLPPELDAVRYRVVKQILGPPGGAPGGAGLPPVPGEEEIIRDAAAGTVTWLVPDTMGGEVKDGRLALSLAGEKAAISVFSLPAALVDELRRQQAGLELDTGSVNITLAPAALQLPAGAAKIDVTIKEEDPATTGTGVTAGPGYRPASLVYTLTATDGKLLEGAAARIKLAGATDADIDRELTGVYRIEEQGAPAYLGGKPLADTSCLTFTLPGAGRYLALEYRAPFADLGGHWAARDVAVMAARHLAAGVGEGRFEPDRAITRAEFTALLQRALALPAAGAGKEFSDVPAAAWYSQAVAAAVAAGVAGGYEDNTFRPAQRVTRAEMAAMLANALALRGQTNEMDAGRAAAHLQPFSDREAVPEWARAAVAQAVAAGIIGGRDGGLAPAAGATRAEAVVMLRRLVDKL